MMYLAPSPSNAVVGGCKRAAMGFPGGNMNNGKAVKGLDEGAWRGRDH
jgi:hypothetical protein